MNNGARYIPEKIFNVPMKLVTVSRGMLYKTAKVQEKFYSVKDGLWNDPETWETVSGRPGKTPTSSDDVYIKHIVTIPSIAGGVLRIGNLYVSYFGKLQNIGLGNAIHLEGIIKAYGELDFGSIAAAPVYIYGTDIFIDSTRNNVWYNLFYTGDSTTIKKPVLGGTYSFAQVDVSFATARYLTSDLVIGVFNYSGGTSWVELGNYDLTVTGTSNGTALTKRGSGNILFSNNSVALNGIVLVTGNSNWEFRGGFILYAAGPVMASYFAGVPIFASGDGTWRFTTNNQTITLIAAGLVTPFDANIEVGSGVTLTLAASGILQVNNTLNGVDGTSTFINRGAIYLNINTVPMNVGTLDIASFANTLGYIFSGAFTLPRTAYWHLRIGNSGTKTLSGNTVLTGGVLVTAPGILELSTYNFEATSLYLTLGSGGVPLFNKTGAGTIKLGNITQDTYGAQIKLPGNPTIELTGGMTSAHGAAADINWGTGILTLSTNNQTFGSLVGAQMDFAGNVLISGAITITVNAIQQMQFSGTLDGNNVGSTFVTKTTIQYKHSTMPMVTGVLDTNSFANTFKYNKAGAQDVKGGTYRIIEFGGSGVKTLQGNVVINATAGGSQSTTGTASVNLNGFTITTI